jgi:uncharacterized DUF497 family protein
MTMARAPHYVWDPAKSESNFAKHRVWFDAVAKFVWTSAIVLPDERQKYEEARWIAFGSIAGRTHVLVFTFREPALRVISLRKANRREQEIFEIRARR